MASPLRQMRWQIAVVYTLLIVLILASLASVLYVLSRNTYLRTLEDGIVGQAYLVATLAELMPPDSNDAHLDALVDSLSQQLAARITIIDPTGTMRADSLLPPERYTNRRDRPEVEQALRTGLGETQRHSSTTDDDRFYVAVPFERAGKLAGVVRIGVPLTIIADTQAQIALAVLTAALLAAGISFTLAVLIARRTTQPLLELRDMAERLASGDLDVRVPVPSGEEVGTLAQSFNQMAGRLRQLVDVRERERERLATILATMHDGILILDADNQVTLANHAATEMLALLERPPFPVGNLAVGPVLLDAAQMTRSPNGGDTHQLIDELTPQATSRSLRAIITRLGERTEPQTLVMLQDLTELRRTEHSWGVLLTNITHDLRTPLASLQALLDALLDGAVDDPETGRDFLARMDIEVQGLKHLVGEFLKLSRIELGQPPTQRSPADVLALLHSVAGRIEAQARQKGVLVAVVATEPLPTVDIDRGQIEQVLLNLLQNALTHTPTGGRISVNAQMYAGEVVIAVQDSGIGIDAAHLPYIFDRFYKADPSRSDGGIGLGLAIAKQLIEHHNGRIWANSTPGSGTTFTFALPTEPGD